MPSAYSTKLAEAFSAKVMQEMYANALFDMIVNRDYEGDINEVGSICNILSFQKLTEQVYNGSNLSVADLNGGERPAHDHPAEVVLLAREDDRQVAVVHQGAATDDREADRFRMVEERGHFRPRFL